MVEATDSDIALNMNIWYIWDWFCIMVAHSLFASNANQSGTLGLGFRV